MPRVTETTWVLALLTVLAGVSTLPGRAQGEAPRGRKAVCRVASPARLPAVRTAGARAEIRPSAAAPRPAASEDGGHCRLWGCISTSSIPAGLIPDHLLNLPNSLVVLSRIHRNGWGLVGFPADGGRPFVQRGAAPAFLDSAFPAAVAHLEQMRPATALCHLRICSSGLCDIPDPHPFQRFEHGRRWFMAHNGTIDKGILLELIRPEYLRSHPPVNGANPTHWIDTELYFLYLLQTCEDHGWDVESALAEVILHLRRRLPPGSRSLNILLSDGQRLWAYREGFSLYFLYDSRGGVSFTAVASQYPGASQEGWTSMRDGQVLIARREGPPRLEWIEDLAQPTAVFGEGTPRRDEPALTCRPNPANGSQVIRWVLPAAGPVELEIFDVLGHRVALLASGILNAGPHEFLWDGNDAQGHALASGVYFLRLRQGRRVERSRLTVLR